MGLIFEKSRTGILALFAPISVSVTSALRTVEKQVLLRLTPEGAPNRTRSVVSTARPYCYLKIKSADEITF